VRNTLPVPEGKRILVKTISRKDSLNEKENNKKQTRKKKGTERKRKKTPQENTISSMGSVARMAEDITETPRAEEPFLEGILRKGKRYPTVRARFNDHRGGGSSGPLTEA